MGALVPFAFGEALVRVVEVHDAPWWIAADVAKVLGYRDAHNMCRILSSDEKGTHNVSTPGGSQEMAIVSESGLYHAIFNSRREEAESFRKWVTAEVLPAIRRNGFYVFDPRAAELQAMRDRPVSEKAEAARARRIATMSYLEYLEAEGVPVTRATEMAAQRAGCSVSTIWNWRTLVRMVPDADRPVALTPQYVGGGRMAECHPAAWEALCRFVSRSDMRVGTAIKKTRELADANGWAPMPCNKTLFRRIMALRGLTMDYQIGRSTNALSLPILEGGDQ